MKQETKIPAHLSGIETEGPLTGQLVCPEINLWAIDKGGRRVARIRKLKHDHPVFILAEKQGIAGETLCYIRDRKFFNARGWVTSRFVVKDEDSDVGAAGVS